MRKLLLTILVLFLTYPHVYAQSQTNDEIDWSKVDWDKIETDLYWNFIEEGEVNLAAIHEKIGYSLLNTDNQWERATVYFKKAVELDPKPLVYITPKTEYPVLVLYKLTYNRVG